MNLKIFFQRLTLAFQMIAICPIAIWNVNLRAALLTYIVQKVQLYPTEITATLTGFDKYCPKYKVRVFGHNLISCAVFIVGNTYIHKCACSMEETIMYKFSANLNFLFLSLCVYLFKTCPSQFFSHWELAEPVFCCEELSCHPYYTKTNAWFSVLWWENSNLLYGENV